MSLAYGKLLHYLFSEFNKMIMARKDQLPLKAKRKHYPELLWINPPFHSSFINNSQQNKFAKAMDTTAAVYADNWSLQLKRIWDTQGRELYLDQVHKFSAKGLMTYWMAVDRTIKFWDTALSPLHKSKKKAATTVSTTATFNSDRNNCGHRRTNKFFWKRKREF